MSDDVRVVQLSDTHFLEPGAEPEGGGAYDTSEAFDAVFEHIEANDSPHLVVVTGDVADHGRQAQYRIAAEALARFKMPVNLCPGNHDQEAAFRAGVGRLGVGTSRVIEAGSWCFLFVDSNAGVMVEDASGRHVDPVDPAHRLHRNGALGDRESAWVREMCAATAAEHVFIWVHHPPSAPIPMIEDANYASEWDALLEDLRMIKGIAAGHTHIPDEYDLHGRRVFVCPAFKNNFDLEAQTWLPPGYRSFDFTSDGQVFGQVHLVDDDRWPRRRFGRALLALFNGELTHAELQEIVARKAAAQ